MSDLHTERTFDCVVVGSCVVDVLARPVPLTEPVGQGALIETAPLLLTTGGFVPNVGIALARLGMRTAALTYLGEDEWADVIRRRLASAGINTSAVSTRHERGTSTSAVLIDDAGERSFLHYGGAARLLDKHALLSRLEMFAASRCMLLGYYPLLPQMLSDLVEIFATIRDTGCLTALDASGDGGGMEPLCHVLPHLDFYLPNEAQAAHQTGTAEPRAMIEAFRNVGATGLVGIKCGPRGALLSPRPGEWLEVAAITPPGPVVDTTGAGDTFLAGLVAGILRGLAINEAARLAAATAACCVTQLGATTAIRDFAATAALAGIQTAAKH